VTFRVIPSNANLYKCDFYTAVRQLTVSVARETMTVVIKGHTAYTEDLQQADMDR